MDNLTLFKFGFRCANACMELEKVLNKKEYKIEAIEACNAIINQEVLDRLSGMSTDPKYLDNINILLKLFKEGYREEYKKFFEQYKKFFEQLVKVLCVLKAIKNEDKNITPDDLQKTIYFFSKLSDLCLKLMSFERRRL